MRTIVIGMAALLAGCSETDTAATNNAVLVQGGAAKGPDYVAAVRGMNPELRKATLLRAIRDARQPCQQVAAEQAAGENQWSARCEDGSGWLITIQPDGNAKVTGPVARK